MSEDLDHVAAGGLAYVDDRMDDARLHWEAAFRELRSASRPAAAARVATLLGELHWGGLGNPSTGRGWIERARRLLDDSGPCVEWGYWELARLACDRPDPVEVESSARRALAIAAEFDDVGLHTRALADLGFALVSQGHLDDGFAHLDETLAALTGGEVTDPFTVSTSCCALLSACDRAGDAERAAEWLRIVRRLVLEPAGGRPRMLGAHCQVALGGVMCTVGDWDEAEDAVRSALRLDSGATAAQRAEAAARLADIEVQRGRTELAAELLAPIEDQVAAAGPLAQLHLARSEPESALVVLQRATAQLGGDVLRSADLLLLTVRAALSCGRPEVADGAADRLRDLSDSCDAPVVGAMADLARGLCLAGAGLRGEATHALEAARATIVALNRPGLAAQTWLALAESSEDRAEAVAAARAAHAIAVRLGNPLLRDRAAAVMRGHGAVAPRRLGTGVLPDLTERETEILQGLRRGDTNAQIAARLYVSTKTVEHHVSRVLAKLGVRTRAEAAAVAAAADT